MLDKFLLSLLILALVLWIGGALTGQVILLRSRLTGDRFFSASFIRIVSWLIPSLYVPASLVAAVSGLLLAYRRGLPLTHPWLLYLYAVYLATVLLGSFYSLPEYRRLSTAVHPGQVIPASAERRLTRASWLNRLELLLLLSGLVGLLLTL